MNGGQQTLAFISKYKRLSSVLKNEVRIQNNGNITTGLALWDTGATCTAISKQVVNSLGLIPAGKNTIKTPSGKTDVNTYLVDIILPNNLCVKDIEVIDSEIGEQGIDVLIGMNIIALGDFCVSNHNGETWFTFRTPSKKHTDYLAELIRENTIGTPHGKGKRKK